MSKKTHAVSLFAGVLLGVGYAEWCYENGIVDRPDPETDSEEQTGGDDDE